MLTPDQCFEEAGNLSLKSAYFLNCVMLLIGGDGRLPAESKCMDDHAVSVYSTA